MTRDQRWTLAVVCAATAMLMLDMAVVNVDGLHDALWVGAVLAAAASVATALLIRPQRRDSDVPGEIVLETV